MDTTMSPSPAAFSYADVPTPPASSIAPSHHPSPLPQPRKKPLKPGSSKESELIQYLDHGITSIKRRWAKRMFKDEEIGKDDVRGYHNFKEAATDIDSLIDVIWVSSSPNLQIPYLLSIALMIADFLHDFLPAPRATFQLLDKLDHAFSSLLQGKNSDTCEFLPGFEGGRTVTTTDKVRLKSIVERTRLTVVEVLSRDNREDRDVSTEFQDERMEEDIEQEGRKGDTVKFEGFNEDDDDDDDDDEREEMHIAKVYERTIGELGDVLGGPPIGIITDD
ncbi:hypothetical protein CC78DRAFT_524298 [Lojkania enalia]|uniref:Meiotic recombination protein DMC1 n=1 Tax=Lojkania enalia TaxID=147567 RepID=A0A9P4MZT4_9PLEO|nr:hypothetical protein CC78DRAFT_524298 [Didymosphaeria enalia]